MKYRVDSNNRSEKSEINRITTARDLGTYCYDLGITKELLATGRVLNVGCGASNIDKDLPRSNEGGVVNIDIQHDPYFSIMHNPLGSIAAKLATIFIPSRIDFKRKLAGVEGRTIAQADAQKLPFSDDQFDFVLAFWSTYQLPFERRVQAFREMIRVGKHIHIAPIFESDLEALYNLQHELNFTVISSSPHARHDLW